MRSQAEKLAAYTRATARSSRMSSNSPNGADIAMAGTSAHVVERGNLGSAPQRFVVESDSGLRGLVHKGAVEHLPPQYSAE